MKTAILLFIVSLLCGTFFTGCPHDTQTEQEPDKYSRDFIFDKEEFDNQRKAWEDAGIKNYYFTRGFNIGGTVVLEKITVENGKPISKELYYINWNGDSIYGEQINFQEYEEKASGLYKDSRHISKDFAEEIQQTPLCTIEDIYTSIKAEYLSMKAKDMKQEKIVKIENKIQYDFNYHIPLFFEWKIMSEKEYDGAHLNGESFGWKNQIYDFKVLD